MAYVYNNRNQKTKATHADGSYWSYGYDSDGNVTAVGQVTSATTFTASNTAFPGLDNSYTYDDIGNRKTAGANANALSGNYAFSGNYYVATNGTGNVGANLLNQYGSRDVPRKLDIFGFADANSTVTVNGNSTTWVEDFWFKQLSFSGNNSTQWAALNITAVLGGNTTSVTGNRFLSANPEVYSYDADGNLLSDGRWTYTWDAENRLTQLITSSDAVTAGVTKQKITFAYDDQNRRVQKKVYGWNGSAWNSTPDVNLLYLYDGWNLAAEMDVTGTATVARSYAWGTDLSGSLRGAGGVGGLLMANLGDGNTTQMAYYGYDGNGNVNALIDTSGNVIGYYDYDAFGKTVQMTGAWAGYNNYRFANEYLEASATYGGVSLGIYNNKERCYLPELGRFANRDPIEEDGGVNLYAICHNELNNLIDSYGEVYDVRVVRFDALLGHEFLVIGPYNDIARGFYGPPDPDVAVPESFGNGTGGSPIYSANGVWVNEYALKDKDHPSKPDATVKDQSDINADKWYGWDTELLTTDNLQAGSHKGCPCSTAKLEYIWDSLFTLTNPGPSDVPYCVLGGNCRDRAEDVLTKSCLKIGALFHDPAKYKTVKTTPTPDRIPRR